MIEYIIYTLIQYCYSIKKKKFDFLITVFIPYSNCEHYKFIIFSCLG